MKCQAPPVLFLVLGATALGACEGRNWEPIQVDVSVTGQYADGEPIDISGKWVAMGDPRDRVEGVGRQSNSSELWTGAFTPKQATPDHEWYVQLGEMADPFFLWDTPFANLYMASDLTTTGAFAVENLTMRVDELRLDGRLWSDASFSADLTNVDGASAQVEGRMKLSYQCSNLFWSFGGFCTDFENESQDCQLSVAPVGCPEELAETFFSPGASSTLEGGSLDFGAESLDHCATRIPHAEDKLNEGGPDGHVAPGACLSDVQTVSADGCDWDVQGASYDRYGLNVSARAQDGCTREVTTCAFQVACREVR